MPEHTQKQIVELQEQLQEEQKQVQDLEGKLAEGQNRIDELQAQLVEGHNMINELEQQMLQKQKQVQEAELQLVRCQCLAACSCVCNAQSCLAIVRSRAAGPWKGFFVCLNIILLCRHDSKHRSSKSNQT